MASFSADSIKNIIGDNESVRVALVNSDGVTRGQGEDRDEVARTVAMVVTDRAIRFVTLGETEREVGAVRYGKLATLDIRDSDVVTIRTTEGESWSFELPEIDAVIRDAVASHLRWIGDVRQDVIQSGNDVDMSAGRIRDLATEMEWDRAKEIYRQIRDKLDRLICTVQLTTPVEETVLAPELTEMERTLEDAHVRLYIERAEAELELGRYLIEREKYERAKDVLQQAHTSYRIAEDQSDAVERADAFEFGTQRDLNDDLQSLGWEIETIAAEPLRQAHEARVLAESTEDTEQAIDHWETAFERYSQVLTLTWREEERNFAGDPEEIRVEREVAVDRLIDLHSEVASELWDVDATDPEEMALQDCQAASNHVERAYELATEFDHEAADDLQYRLMKQAKTLRSLRDDRDESWRKPAGSDGDGGSASGESTPGEHGTAAGTEQDGPPDTAHTTTAGSDAEATSSDADSTSETESATSDTGSTGENDSTASETSEGKGADNTDEEIPSVTDITAIDTHHDITLDLDDHTDANRPATPDEKSERDGSAQTVPEDGDATEVESE